MAIVPVVKIKHKTAGFCLINADEFDSTIHELFDEVKPTRSKQKQETALEIVGENNG